MIITTRKMTMTIMIDMLIINPMNITGFTALKTQT